MDHREFDLQLFSEAVPFDTAAESAANGVLTQESAQEGCAPESVPVAGGSSQADAGAEASAEAAPPVLRFREHIEGLHRQGEAMKAAFPGFDLRRELEDPVFRKLTSPSVGLSVEDAYYAVHRRELQNVAVQRAALDAAKKTANAVRAGQMRPVENGSAAKGASVTTFDYRAATREQREALRKRIMDAGARGEKIYP